MTMAGDPWDISRRRQTVQEFLGVGSDAGLPEPIRFVRAVAGLIRRRIAANADSGGFAYFLLHPPAQVALTGQESTRVAMLDLGRDRVTQRLWFVNCVANDGVAVEIGRNQSHTAVVQLVTDDLSLGTVPALMLDTSETPVVRFFPNGLSDLQTVSTIPLQSEGVDWERIRITVDGVYRSSLITPEVQNPSENLWEDAPKYWVASDAEYKVQSAVKAALAGAFPYCDIRAEQPQAEGRHDLLIEESASDPNGGKVLVPHAMIEIKVLRSRNSGGTSVSDNATSAWAISGVRQAHSYGVGRHSHLFLAIFIDARLPSATLDCLQAAHDLAGELSVTIGRWKVYGKSADLRSAMAEEVSRD